MSIRDELVEALLEVAPEVDPATLDDAAPLQEQLDLDSMDFLAFLEGVVARTGVDIPERDYDRVVTLAGCVEYVAAQGAA